MSVAFIKKEFVARVLKEEFGSEMLANQTRKMTKVLNFSSSSKLRDTRSVEVTKAKELDAIMTFSHPIYERFLDIKKRKRNDKRRKVKSFKIHNRFIFGHYYQTAYKLMYGFTNEVADNIIKELKANGYE